MSVTPLPSPRREAPAPESLAATTRRMHEESLARIKDQSRALEQAVWELGDVTTQIAGDAAYPPGVREVARRLALELGAARTNLQAILYRNGF